MGLLRSDILTLGTLRADPKYIGGGEGRIARVNIYPCNHRPITPVESLRLFAGQNERFILGLL